MMEMNREALEFLERVAPGYVGIYRVDGDSVQALYSSPNLHELLGMTAEEFEDISKKDVSQVIYAEDLPDVLDAVHHCVATGEPFDRYARVIHKTAGLDWVHGNVSRAGELDGGTILLATFSNASVESNIYLRVIDNSERMVYVCDRNTYEVLYMNRAAHLNHSDGHLGEACYSCIRGKDEPCENCYLKDIVPGQQMGLMRHDKTTGAWEHLTCECIDWCGHDAFVQYIDNVTESELLRRDLQDAKNRYELAIESAELGVWEYDIQTHTITSPSSSFKRFGVPDRIENVPESILPMFPERERERLRDMFRRLDQGESKVTEDFWMQWRPDDPPRCERVVYSVIKKDGKPAIAYGIGMNVTLEKEEQDRYERLLQSLLTANPDALCAFELNLTKNTCQEGHGTSPFIMWMLQSDTVDGLFANIRKIITDEGDLERFDATFTREGLLKAFDEGRSSLSIDYRRRGEDGKPFWARSYANSIRNPETQDITSIMYSIDVSEERRRDEILRVITSQEYDLIGLLHLDTNLFEAVFVGDSLPAEYRAFFPEPGSSCMFKDLCETSAARWIDPENVDDYVKFANPDWVRRRISKDEHYEFTMAMHFPDDPRPMIRRRYQHYRLEDDPDVIVVVESDITETYRKQQEALDQAKAEANRVQDILGSISAGICVLHMPDPDHLTIEYVNHQMYRMLGFTPSDNPREQDDTEQSEMVNAYLENAFMGVHPDDAERVRRTFRDNYGSSHFVVDNYRTAGAGGAYFWIREEVTLREITPEDRVFYAVYYDVSEEVRLSQRLMDQVEEEKSLRAQAQAANASKSTFMSSVSHDMRTPLNGVLGYADLALASDDLDTVRGYLLKTKDAGNTLLALINDTLDLSKIETGKLELHKKPVACGDVVRHIVTAVKPTMDAKHITFVLDNERATMANVNVDILLLEKVFLNLLNNAVKFTPAGGQITFVIECVGLDSDCVHDRISVSDTGVGISPEFLPKVFEPFEQERTEKTSNIGGSGLGLSIVKDIVDLMGGRIEVKSELGRGTTFTVWLDLELAQGDVKREGESPEGELPDDAIRDLRVLLVEDNAMNVEIGRTLLERQGAKVTRAENGQVAVEMFERTPEDYDVILMDIRMPVMDGYEATKAIRSLDFPRAKTIPIIAMSADAYDSDVRRSLSAGMCDHVAKPIDPPVMYRAIYRACKGR